MISAFGVYPQVAKEKADNTHYVEAGARTVAALAARELQRLDLPFSPALALSAGPDAPPAH